MPGNDIFIAFANKNTALAVAKTVIAAGKNVASVTLSANALRERISYYSGGIIICGCRFHDENINTLAEDIPEGFRIITVGSSQQLAEVGDPRVLKLAVPLNSADLLAYIDMLTEEERRSSRTPQENAIINKAKRSLINTRRMTEDQAHRFLEQKSMETGQSMVRIAERILSRKNI